MHVLFFPVVLESLDEGTSPPCYLVDGLKELVYSFKEWTRTREVRTGWGSPRGEDGWVLPEVRGGVIQSKYMDQYLCMTMYGCWYKALYLLGEVTFYVYLCTVYYFLLYHTESVVL